MTHTPVAAAKAFLVSGPMAVRGFRWLLVGQFTSSIGDLCFAIALPWLILSSDAGPMTLGAVLACYGVSRAIAIPAGGVLADRLGPRTVMLATDVVRFVLTLSLAVVAATVTPTFAVLALIATGLGLCGGLFVPASFALLPAVLPEKELAAGNSMSSVATQLGTLLGPALGGILVSGIGPGPALAVDAVSYLVSAAALLTLRVPRAAAARDEAAEEGAVTFRSVLLRGRFLQVVLVASLIGNFVYAGAAEVALPTLAHDSFGAGGYGVILAGLGAGMIVGALMARWEPPRLGPGAVVAVLALVMGASVAAVPFAGGLAGAVVCITVFAVANGWSGTLIVTMLQRWAPRHVLARVMSVILLAMSGTFPLSVAATGWGVERFGVTMFFPVAGCAIALAILWAFSRPAFRNYRPGDQFTGSAVQEPLQTYEERT
ncbi:MFS transporter [Nonomuraea phyllanthi]|uniref:Multidrug efflux pump Tap n=1 Tax=Nonomuraea phyllanthi TaxID=2219224 RepID=A0A5C4WIP1_9ACTN|nr:MFS transporter [Nonomuraea phyllanthi]KAB8194180.1 MFS transporter [Nonomuraea phyllanthi]QFY07780.1 MFS transporter [Nonomuraea phyllanthi]